MEADERPTKKRRLSTEEGQQTTGTPDEMPADSSTTVDKAIQNATVLQADDNVTTEAANGHNLDDQDINDDLNNLLPASDNDDESDLPPPTTTAPFASTLDPTQPPLSKNQQKKLAKKAEWESKREDRKALRKEKATAKRLRRREERQTQEAENPVPPPAKKLRPPKPVTLPITILIDCDFDDLMRDNERVSLAAQITRSYSDNKNALFRAHLAVCSFGGKLRERFEGVLGHYRMWRGVRFVQESFVDAAELAKGWMSEAEGERGGVLKGAFGSYAGQESEESDDAAVREKLRADGEVVYLSSESPDTLTTLKPYSTYIIGGLVDKNREKGICYKRAVAAGIRTAKLPIGEFMEMQSRKVLATNHVNEIMVRWLETGDWGEAFLKVIPKRKGGKLKDVEDAAADADEIEDGDYDGGVAIDETRTAGDGGATERAKSATEAISS